MKIEPNQWLNLDTDLSGKDNWRKEDLLLFRLAFIVGFGAKSFMDKGIMAG